MGQIRLMLCATAVAATALSGSVATAHPAIPTATPTLSVDRACYVNTARAAAPIMISGSGWQAGATVELSDTLQVLSSTATASSTGTFTATIPAPLVDTSHAPDISDRIAGYVEGAPGLTATTGGATIYSAPFLTTNYAVTESRAITNPQKATFELSGFAPNRTVYAHYLSARGRLLTTVSFGKPKGACGLRRVETDAYPGGHPKRGTDTIQFDNSRRYRARTSPAFRLSLEF